MSRTRYVTLLLAAAWFTTLAPDAAGQWHTSKVSVPDDLVVRQHLSRAEDAIRQKDPKRAIRFWQDILDRLAGKVVEAHRAPRLGSVTDSVVAGDRFIGVRGRVMERIRSIENGLGQYREKMEPKAKRMLESAVAQENENQLRSCARRYFLTQSGQAAHLALIDLLIEHGRFEEARLATQRFQTELRLLDPEDPAIARVMAREAVALWGARRLTDLHALAERASKAGAGSLTVGSDRIDVAAFIQSLVRRTGQAAPSKPPVRPPLTVFSSRVWNRPFNRNLKTSTQSVFFNNSPRMFMVNHFPVIPTVRGGVVFFADGRVMKARSLFTGMDIWPGVPGLLHDFAGRRNRNLYYHVTVDGDLAFAYLQGHPVMEGQRAWQGFEPIETIPSHKLVAVDVNTGDTRWSHLAFSGRDPDENNFISRLNVNQPPLVVGDTLYVAGTVLLGVFHQWICAFERDTGHLKWKTYTGAGQQELNMFGNPVKEGIPGHVTEHHGVIYYTTNIGVACAVDAVTGTILWESAYDQEPIPSTDSPVTKERHPGWMASRPAVWKDRVFFAPTDSYNVYAADMATGALTRVKPATRTVMSRNYYFLGIHEGVLLVAGSRITAIDPDTLQRRWQTVELVGRWDKGSVQGLPAIHGHDLLFTSTSRNGRSTQVNRVDLRTGRFLGQETLRFSSREGNIVVSPDAMVVGGEESVHAYFDLGEVEQRLARSSRTGVPNPELQMRLGDVRQRQGQWGQALEAWGKALDQSTKQGPRGRAIAQRAALSLFNGWIKMAGEPNRPILSGPTSPEARYHKALTYARTDAQRVRALRECLDWSLSENDDAAFKRTAKLLIDRHAEQPLELAGEIHGLFPELPNALNLPAGLMATLASGAHAENARKYRAAVTWFHHAQVRWPDAPVGRLTAWRYAGDRIARIIKTHGRGMYRPQEQAAKRVLREAVQNDDLQGIRTVLRHYPQSTVVEKAYLELSRRLLAAGKFQDALGEMQRYFTRFGAASPAARYEYARCLDRLGATDSAAGIMRSLMLHHGDAVIRSAGATIRVRGWVKKMLAEERYQHLAKDPEEPTVARNGHSKWKKTGPQGGDEVRLIDPWGRPPAKMSGTVLVHLGRELLAINATTGITSWRKASVAIPHFAAWQDGRLVVGLDSDIVAVDALSGAEHWRVRPEGGDLRDLMCGHGKVYMLLRSVVQGGLILHGLDITSGAIVQTIAMRGYYEGTLSISPSYLLVRTPRQRKATCYDGLTGEKVGSPIPFDRDGPLPFLTKKDEVVVVYGSDRRSREIVKVVSRDPKTGKDTWAYEAGRGTFIALTVEKDQLVFELRVPTSVARTSGGARPNHRLVVLDLGQGTPKFTAQLERNEFSTDATVSGKRLYLSLMASVKTGTGIAQKIRVYDMMKGNSPWATTEFPGANIRLWVYPTSNHLLLRKSVSIRSRRSGPGDAAELYFIDQKNGKVVDLIELGQDSGMMDSPGMVVKDGTLVLTSGTEVKGYGK
ncbi:MAG: hypothetical protein CL908_17730 [Deltaproteobacteria bacterium]|nr:hypothetical protein [Deltaproteobacteria bacterium]